MRFDSGEVNAPVTQREEWRFLHHVWPLHSGLRPATMLRLRVFQVAFDDAVSESASQLDRINSGHRDVSRVEHEIDLLRVRMLHYVIDLAPVLELAPHMSVNRELDAFVRAPFADLAERSGHMLQIFIGGSGRATRPHIDLQVLAAEFFDEPDQLRMVFNDLLVSGGVLESHLHRTAVGDGHKTNADLIHLSPELAGFIVVKVLEVVDKRFDVAVTDLARLAER